VTAVKGMIVQVMENLISNSVYWLKQRRKLDVDFRPKISVTIDTRHKEIRFNDNGPGVPPEKKDDIFRPFFTTKPPGEGKGLGLFISREIAHYHGGEVYLSDIHAAGKKTLNTFVFSLEANGK
jgi:signal transduction histidine kinase